MNEIKNSSSTVSLMESNPREAWELLAKLEFEGPGGMTGLPVLRHTLSEEDRRKMNARKTRENVVQLKAASATGKQVVGKLNISTRTVSVIKKKFRARLRKRRLLGARA
jgi:hypothetical protein